MRPKIDGMGRGASGGGGAAHDRIAFDLRRATHERDAETGQSIGCGLGPSALPAADLER